VPPKYWDRLTTRERLTLELVGRGCTPDEIAALEQVPVMMVLKDLQRAMQALRAPTVRRAVWEAHRPGLLISELAGAGTGATSTCGSEGDHAEDRGVSAPLAPLRSPEEAEPPDQETTPDRETVPNQTVSRSRKSPLPPGLRYFWYQIGNAHLGSILAADEDAARRAVLARHPHARRQRVTLTAWNAGKQTPALPVTPEVR
jgi:DNA-binding CsgD family transcriptional regulator